MIARTQSLKVNCILAKGKATTEDILKAVEEALVRVPGSLASWNLRSSRSCVRTPGPRIHFSRPGKKSGRSYRSPAKRKRHRREARDYRREASAASQRRCE